MESSNGNWTPSRSRGGPDGGLSPGTSCSNGSWTPSRSRRYSLWCGLSCWGRGSNGSWTPWRSRQSGTWSWQTKQQWQRDASKIPTKHLEGSILSFGKQWQLDALEIQTCGATQHQQHWCTQQRQLDALEIQTDASRWQARITRWQQWQLDALEIQTMRHDLPSFQAATRSNGNWTPWRSRQWAHAGAGCAELAAMATGRLRDPAP